MFGFWTGVICVKVVGNQETICYFIVLLLLSCGQWFVFGIHLVMLGTVVDLVCWQGKFACYYNGVIWKAISHCLMWCVWRERNNQISKDLEMTLLDLKLLFFRTLIDWMSAVGSHSLFWICDLIDVCNLSVRLFLDLSCIDFEYLGDWFFWFNKI